MNTHQIFLASILGLLLLAVIVTILILALSNQSCGCKKSSSSPRPPSPSPSPSPSPTPSPSPPKNNVMEGEDILSFFKIYQNRDPTNGCVDYQKFSALPNDLCYVSKNHFFIETAGANGNRVTFSPTENVPSIRLYSHTIFNGGLFSFELFHVPAGNGVWPAIWFSQDGNQTLPDGSMGKWPDNGEFDLFEQVNNANQNQSTLHIGPYTAKGMCVQSGEQWSCPGEPTKSCGTDCTYICNPTFTPDLPDWGVPTCSTNLKNNTGCLLLGPDNSFGEAFNGTFYEGKSAVISFDWKRMTDTNFILTCYLISDPTVINDQAHGPFSPSPDTSQWQKFKYATFDSSDKMKSNCPFRDAQIIINITLCGDWAGSVFKMNSPEDPKTACENYVKTKGNLKDAYFEFGRIAYMQ